MARKNAQMAPGMRTMPGLDGTRQAINMPQMAATSDSTIMAKIPLAPEHTDLSSCKVGAQ